MKESYTTIKNNEVVNMGRSLRYTINFFEAEGRTVYLEKERGRGNDPFKCKFPLRKP